MSNCYSRFFLEGRLSYVSLCTSHPYWLLWTHANSPSQIKLELFWLAKGKWQLQKKYLEHFDVMLGKPPLLDFGKSLFQVWNFCKGNILRLAPKMGALSFQVCSAKCLVWNAFLVPLLQCMLWSVGLLRIITCYIHVPKQGLQRQISIKLTLPVQRFL